MSSVRLLLACIALFALPLASAAPTDPDPPAGAEVCQGHNPGIHVWAPKYDSGCREFGPPPAAVAAAPEPVEVYPCFAGGYTIVVLGQVSLECVGAGAPTVEQCGHVAYRVDAGPATTGCVVIIEFYACPGGGGYVAVLGVPLGECRPCCGEPWPLAAERPDATVDPFPLWGAEPCPEGQGSRLYVAGKPVTQCREGPAAVDLRCMDPGYGVQVHVDGQPVTDCVPLPHGV